MFFHESPQQISFGSFNMSYQKCCPSFLFAVPGIGMRLCGWCLVRRLLAVYRFFLSCFCGDVSYLRSVSGGLKLVNRLSVRSPDLLPSAVECALIEGGLHFMWSECRISWAFFYVALPFCSVCRWKNFQEAAEAIREGAVGCGAQASRRVWTPQQAWALESAVCA